MLVWLRWRIFITDSWYLLLAFCTTLMIGWWSCVVTWIVFYLHAVLWEPRNIIPLYLYHLTKNAVIVCQFSKYFMSRRLQLSLAKSLHGQFYSYIQSGKVNLYRGVWRFIETVSTVRAIQWFHYVLSTRLFQFQCAEAEETIVFLLAACLVLGQHLLIPCFLSPARMSFSPPHW